MFTFETSMQVPQKVKRHHPLCCAGVSNDKFHTLIPTIFLKQPCNSNASTSSMLEKKGNCIVTYKLFGWEEENVYPN